MNGHFRFLAGLSVIAMLASCDANGRIDGDLRGLVPGGLDTSGAAQQAAARPAPDARGIISYADYQVAVARQGDTPAAVAARVGLGADELARHNALDANASLEAGAILALPRRVGTAQQSAAAGRVRDPFATVPKAQAAKPAPAQPKQHVVASGETAWSIARKYGVGIAALAEWNGLGEDMKIRVGQRLLIPVAGAVPSNNGRARVSAPGVGSPTPTPPSAAAPLPKESTRAAAQDVEKPPAPDLGATRTVASGTGKFMQPVQGSIIRPYDKGKNEGIDFSASAGSPVKAAGSGRVAAITKDGTGVPIIVIRHSGELMTVYTGVDNLTVSKGDAVTAGQVIGKVASAGIVHFEVRRGFDSQDPENYL